MFKSFIAACFLFCAFSLTAQETEVNDNGDTAKVKSEKSKKIIDELTYQTHAGLPLAASKIYFSENKFTFSGFGEASHIYYDGPKNTGSGDMELYMTNLYRFVGYLAYKPTDRIVLYGEIFAEAFQDGWSNLDRNNFQHEFFLEAFADFLIHPRFNVRVGTHQVQIGYINNHDEPVMYYSVNRPEVERLIVPSQWIDLGVMTYGTLSKSLDYSFSVYQGLDSDNYYGGTWIRGGRVDGLRFNFDAPLLNGQLNYSGLKNTEVSLSGLWTPAGSNRTTLFNGEEITVESNTMLMTSHIRHEYKNWTFMGLGAFGRMNNAHHIYALTTRSLPDGGITRTGEVLGTEVFGGYLEVGYDILPALNKKSSKSETADDDDGNFFYKKSEMKLPIFARYERLNTHSAVHEDLRDREISRNNLDVWTVGMNLNLRKNFVVKANYQFRNNRSPITAGEFAGQFEGDRVEVGMGFIF